ncbi:MAG TPA: hypothetical protein GXZ82_08410 [Firmicutes bacterium]|jgi:hypothetical protein|nr:hypothetical protein [Bacillota bacterium]
MARLIREPVNVTVAANCPCTFTWREHIYCITEQLDDWRETGEWWRGELPRDFYRVKTACGCVFELYCEAQTQAWVLYKVDD